MSGKLPKITLAAVTLTTVCLCGTAEQADAGNTAAAAAPARKQAASAAVALSRDKAGNETFFVFGTGAVGPLAELPAELKRSGFGSADLSAWSDKIDYETLLAALRSAGIEVVRCYVPESGKAAHFRKNPAGPEPEESGERSVVYVSAPIEENAYNRRYKLPGKFEAVRYVTIHNTAEPFSARQERDRVDFRRDNMSVSFHYAVDEREAVQILPLAIHGWHAGDGGRGPGNTESIGIEICRSQCRGAADWQYRRSEANAEILAAALLRHFELTAAELRTHQDWSGKYCPHRILEENRFESFRARVAARLAAEPDREEQALLAGITAR